MTWVLFTYEGPGEGSEMQQPYTTAEEEYLDDEFLEKLDPFANAKWDKTEGPKERAAFKQALANRLTPERNTLVDKILLEIIDLLTEYDDIFSQTPKAPGMSETVSHRIDTTAPPPKTPAMYRRSKPDQDLLAEWVEWMLQNGLIRPSNSPFAQNIIIVKKPGKEPRICLDPRPINKVTVSDPYPMPRMDEIFGSLHGSAAFSLLDAASGFFQVPILEEHRHLAAFRCEQGVFEFCCMPFGLTNAPATFTRWMQMTFQGLDSFLKIYMDDLLIHSSKIEEHPAQLRKIFERCREQQVKLRLTKCHLLQTELKLLGHIITLEGVKKDLDKVEAIRSWGEGRPENQFSPFKNLTQLQSFMGLVNYYKHYHKFIANELVVLNELSRKGKCPKKDWTTTHELAFQKIKLVMVEQTLLYYPDAALMFEIHTDASKYAIGGTLSQTRTGPEGEASYPIEHYSRSLKGPELNYYIGEKEFLAVVSCIEKWKHYLYKPFKVVTDHKPLLGVQHTDKPRFKRWMLRITPYTFDMEHREGARMTDVDPLSRDPRLFRIASEEESDTEPTQILYSSADIQLHATESAMLQLNIVRIGTVPVAESEWKNLHPDRRPQVLQTNRLLVEPDNTCDYEEEREIIPIYHELVLTNPDGGHATIAMQPIAQEKENLPTITTRKRPSTAQIGRQAKKRQK